MLPLYDFCFVGCCRKKKIWEQMTSLVGIYNRSLAVLPPFTEYTSAIYRIRPKCQFADSGCILTTCYRPQLLLGFHNNSWDSSRVYLRMPAPLSLTGACHVHRNGDRQPAGSMEEADKKQMWECPRRRVASLVSNRSGRRQRNQQQYLFVLGTKGWARHTSLCQPNWQAFHHGDIHKRDSEWQHYEPVYEDRGCWAQTELCILNSSSVSITFTDWMTLVTPLAIHSWMRV